MRKILLIIIILAAAASAFGSPLVFKATKEVKSGSITELANLDASKFTQLRILVRRQKEKPGAYEGFERFLINIFVLDETEEIQFLSSGQTYSEFSTVIDAPPSRLKINVSGQGNFKIFIWAN